MTLRLPNRSKLEHQMNSKCLIRNERNSSPDDVICWEPLEVLLKDSNFVLHLISSKRVSSWYQCLFDSKPETSRYSVKAGGYEFNALTWIAISFAWLIFFAWVIAWNFSADALRLCCRQVLNDEGRVE